MVQPWRWAMAVWWGLILSAAARAVDPPEWLPKDAVVVFDCQMRQLLHAPLVRDRLRPLFESSDSTLFPLLATLRSLGISVHRDLDRLTVALTTLDTNDGWLRLEGRFSTAKIDRAAERLAGSQPEKWRWHSDEKNRFAEIRTSPSIYLHSPADHVLILATNKAFLRTGERVAPPRPELRELCEKIEPPSVAWMVMLPEALVAVPVGTDDNRQMLEQVTGVWGRWQLDTHLRCDFWLSTADQNVAKKLRDVLRETLKSGQRWAPGLQQELAPLAPFLDLLREIHTTASDQHVRLVGEWNARQIDDLLRRLARSP